MPLSMILVWRWQLRALHWVLAISTLASFATHEGGARLLRDIHEWTGYVALFAAVARIWLGFAGSGNWRFTSFVRGVSTTWRYALQALSGREPRHIAHNPLGAWMVVALLVCAALAGFSGWLYTTDAFWGVAWVESVHSIFGHAIVFLFVLHLLGVLLTSIRHRENLVTAMLHGCKRSQ